MLLTHYIAILSLAVILDLKGCQYRGRLFPGPTAMVLSVVHKKVGAVGGSSSATQQLKVDGMTDEFCRLHKTGDALAKFDAIVQGDMNDYRFQEVDVNKNNPAAAAAAVKAEAANAMSGTNRKRGSAASSATTATKKRRSSKPKK